MKFISSILAKPPLLYIILMHWTYKNYENLFVKPINAYISRICKPYPNSKSAINAE